VKTNAIIFDQPRKVIFDQVLLPDPTPADIVIRNEVTGVSVGTERWAYVGKRAEIQFPNVPGYMAVGTITSSGKDAQAQGWREGERVYYFGSRFAGNLAGKSWMGSHVAESVVDVCASRTCGGDLKIHHCDKVPLGLAPEETALLGLCGVAMRGIEMAAVPAGAKVLICGLGVIGQYTLQVCLLKGAQVTVTDVVDLRLDVARNLAANHVIHGKNDDLRARAHEIAPDGFDIIIDTSSIAAVVNSLFPLLKMRGKFVFQGWYPPPTALDINAMHARMPTAYFPCAHAADAVVTAMNWAARGWLRSKPLITHTFAPQVAVKAYAMMAEGSENFLGILFDWRAKS
jgi:3-hydroxyethyl bacteriochlorophyllide a dehydrogenase